MCVGKAVDVLRKLCSPAIEGPRLTALPVEKIHTHTPTHSCYGSSNDRPGSHRNVNTSEEKCMKTKTTKRPSRKSTLPPKKPVRPASRATKPPTQPQKKRATMETSAATATLPSALVSRPKRPYNRRKPPASVTIRAMGAPRPARPMGHCEPCGHSWAMRNPTLSRCPACQGREGLTVTMSGNEATKREA